MIVSPPRPVSVPPTEVAYRPPPRVVTNSCAVSFSHFVPWKSSAYQADLTTCRNCR
jgi:hypothetical protein